MDSADVLNIFPELFEVNLNEDLQAEGLFLKIKKIINFDEGYIYFLNPNSAQLKYAFNKQDDLEIEQVVPFSASSKKVLFSEKNLILKKNDKLCKEFNLTNSNSYILTKIHIKSTILGFLILGKKEFSYYSEKHLSILKPCASIVSYLIKDMELSNVFKMQLKALKDGLIEKNEAYKTIKEQNEKILEADKVKNEFLANVSHELRTPLNSILGFSEILATGLYGAVNDKQKEYISDIRTSGIHLLSMINEILDLSKIEAKAVKLVRSQFNIDRAVTEALNILEPLYDKKHITVNKIIEKDFEVFADYQKIQQILYNLINNAIKFTPENGQIDVTCQKNKKNFVMTVHDNGIGIDKKYHGKIFAKFVQLDSAYTKKESSTGLGLTITKELTELHGGKISIISEVNNGSTFIVEIPNVSPLKK
ncbi:HAMP domain-containing histidine kinase [bacterium]|nr:HAMP domain-containing histidine kinase [bacterium]